MTRALLTQALSALILEATSPAMPTTQAAITALSAALAAPQVEPVAWMYDFLSEQGEFIRDLTCDGLEYIDPVSLTKNAKVSNVRPLYFAAPPPAGHIEHVRDMVPAVPGDSTGCAACATCGLPWPAVLWLWKNFVDGKPEYWAFDNPFPVHMTGGDPQTLGEPCGYAIVKPSRQGRKDVSDAEVLRRIAASAQPTVREPLTDAQAVAIFRQAFLACTDPMGRDNMTLAFVRAIEQAHGITGESK